MKRIKVQKNLEIQTYKIYIKFEWEKFDKSKTIKIYELFENYITKIDYKITDRQHLKLNQNYF